MRLRIWPALVFSSICILAAGLALAHQGATGVVKERMELMKGIASAMKVLAPMVQGKSDWDAAAAAQSAGIISDHAKSIPAKFPKGSTGHPSEAKAEIWSKWQEFEASARGLAENAAALQQAADDGLEAAKPLFGKIVGSCKGCHETFREKK